MRADFPPGAATYVDVRVPVEGGTAQQHVAGPVRAAVRHAVHDELVPVKLGVEGGRAQELADSRALGSDCAQLGVAVVGGVVGRANACTGHGARADDGEGGAGIIRPVELSMRRLCEQDEERLYEHLGRVGSGQTRCGQLELQRMLQDLSTRYDLKPFSYILNQGACA